MDRERQMDYISAAGMSFTCYERRVSLRQRLRTILEGRPLVDRSDWPWRTDTPDAERTARHRSGYHCTRVRFRHSGKLCQ